VRLLFDTPQTTFTELVTLLDESKDSSLLIIIVEGKTIKFVRIVSSSDVL
jgi:hypothetical protein